MILQCAFFLPAGNNSTNGASRNRVAQGSHSVLFGTVNVADQGENIVADIGQVNYLNTVVDLT